MSRLVRLATCDVVLVRRSRYGDRGAARRLAARHLERITLLASVVGSTQEESLALARKGFDLALRGGRPFEDALVTAFARLALTLPDADEAHGRLLVLLVEVEQRPVDEVAPLLGLAPDRAAVLLPAARAAAGASGRLRSCRGWGLASRRAGLTDAERQAGQAHLLLCRRCRERLATLDRTRAQLLGGSAGVAGAIAAVQLVPLGSSVPAGVGALVGGKAAAGLVAVAGAAVLATGGAALVVDKASSHAPAHRPAPAVSAPPGSAPANADPLHTASPTPTPAPASTSQPNQPTLPVQVPTQVPAGVPTLPVPLPTLPIPLPTSPLPLVSPLQGTLDDLTDRVP